MHDTVHGLARGMLQHKMMIHTPRRGNTMLLTAVITEAEEGGFIALNPETGTTTQGETHQEAIDNLKEATSLYLDEFPMKIQSHPVMTTFEVSHA
jgi:predicted RNase H-like HicB family nuclease